MTKILIVGSAALKNEFVLGKPLALDSICPIFDSLFYSLSKTENFHSKVARESERASESDQLQTIK